MNKLTQDQIDGIKAGTKLKMDHPHMGYIKAKATGPAKGSYVSVEYMGGSFHPPYTEKPVKSDWKLDRIELDENKTMNQSEIIRNIVEQAVFEVIAQNSSPKKEKVEAKKPKVEKSKVDEISYSDYKADESMTPKQKINSAILEINRLLRKVEHIAAQNKKLKMESNVTSLDFWKPTQESFRKIYERMTNVAKTLRELSE